MGNFKHIKNFATFSQMLKAQNEQKAFEKKSLAQREYADFFLKLLQKYNVSSPAELSDEEKKEFFDKIAKGWESGEGITKAGKKMIDESYVNEANDSKVLVNGFKQIIKGLEAELKDTEDKDLIKLYNEDIKDYELLVDLAKINTKKAIQKWNNLDAATKEYINHYVADKDRKELANVLGVEFRESIITINERNAFLAALMMAKKENKNSFEFKGRIYEVKVKNVPASKDLNKKEINNDK